MPHFTPKISSFTVTPALRIGYNDERARCRGSISVSGPDDDRSFEGGIGPVPLVRYVVAISYEVVSTAPGNTPVRIDVPLLKSVKPGTTWIFDLFPRPVTYDAYLELVATLYHEATYLMQGSMTPIDEARIPFTISSPVISHITVEEDNVEAGTSVVGEVCVEGQGAVRLGVPLKAEPPDAVDFPHLNDDIVKIPAGEECSNFRVRGRNVTSNTSVSISATYGSKSRATRLTVTPSAPVEVGYTRLLLFNCESSHYTLDIYLGREGAPSWEFQGTLEPHWVGGRCPNGPSAQPLEVELSDGKLHNLVAVAVDKPGCTSASDPYYGPCREFEMYNYLGNKDGEELRVLIT